MSVEEFKSKARRHWAEWLPQKVAELKAQGLLEQALQAAASNAQNKVNELQAQGFRPHEAQEVALSEFVLLPPEDGASETPQEREDALLRERAYRQRPPA